MGGYSCTVRLQHASAQSFFDEMVHPDLERLRRRDDFLAKIEAAYPIRAEGTELVAEIPDINIAALMAVPQNEGYVPVKLRTYHYDFSPLSVSLQKQNRVYSNSPVRNIAA